MSEFACPKNILIDPPTIADDLSVMLSFHVLQILLPVSEGKDEGRASKFGIARHRHPQCCLPFR